MKNLQPGLLYLFVAVISPPLQTCALITSPITTTVLGGAQLAIKGTELQKEISKADVREAFDSPFEKTWTKSAKALEDLHIEITKIGTTDEGKGGIMEGREEKIKIKLIGVELTQNITEIGIWAEHDKALGELIAEKIRGEMQKESR
jgi:hypothetical protein